MSPTRWPEAIATAGLDGPCVCGRGFRRIVSQSCCDQYNVRGVLIDRDVPPQTSNHVLWTGDAASGEGKISPVDCRSDKTNFYEQVPAYCRCAREPPPRAQ